MTQLIGIIGAPSTGKTCTAYNLAWELEKNNQSVYLVQEEARRFFAVHSRYLTSTNMTIQQHLFAKQRNREEVGVSTGVDIVLSDSPAFFGIVYYQYSECTNITILPWEYEVAMYLLERSVDNARKYKHVFVLDPNSNPLRSDPGRLSINKEVQQDLHKYIVSFLQLYNIPWTLISEPDMNQRITLIAQKIEGV